jgi:hypothetical protein
MGRKKLYDADEAKKIKKEQTLKSNSKKRDEKKQAMEHYKAMDAHSKEITGMGLFDFVGKISKLYGTVSQAVADKTQEVKDNIQGAIAPVVSAVTDPVQSAVQSAVDTAKDVASKVETKFTDIKDTANAVIHGATRLSKNVRTIMEKVGDLPITEIKIVRKPVQGAVQKLLNIASLGEYQKELDKKPYDTIFHLALVLTIDNKELVVEKNAQISMSYKKIKGGEEMHVVKDKPLTLNELMANTEKMMGDKFIPYDAEHNNCQGFVSSMMRANGLMTPEYSSFITQDVCKLIPRKTKGLVDKVTDLGARIDSAVSGGSLWTKHCKAYAKEHGVSYKQALKEAGATYNKG